MRIDHHSRVLDTYFWHFVDRGQAPEDTPLFTGIYNGASLALVIARELDLPLHQSESTIEITRREVAL